MSKFVYPKRPPFFANQFIRLMTKMCLGNVIGTDACWLLTVVVMTEDEKRYKGGVTFYASNLADQCGFSCSGMERARRRAIEAGWLHHEPGAKGKAAVYWVLIPPEEPDGTSGPSVRESTDFHHQVDGESGEQVTVKTGRKRGACDGESGEHVTHSLPYTSSSSIPTSSPTSSALGDVSKTSAKTKTMKSKNLDTEEFAKFWETYPRKVRKSDAEKAFAKLNPSPELLDQILEAIDRQARSPDWTKENGQFIPHPSTWLNGRRWEDEGTLLPASPPILPSESFLRAQSGEHDAPMILPTRKEPQ